MKFLSSVETLNSIFEWGSLILIAGTVAVGVGAILTSRTIQAKQEASIAQANTKAAEATKAAAEAKNWTKVIRAVRSPKTGAYAFKEAIVHKDKIKEFLAQK